MARLHSLRVSAMSVVVPTLLDSILGWTGQIYGSLGANRGRTHTAIKKKNYNSSYSSQTFDLSSYN